MAGITVVGMGPGGMDYVTEAAQKAVGKANVLVGGRRHLDMYRHLSVEKIPITVDLEPLLDTIRNRVEAGEHVVVLASGDPGFYGILSTLRRRLPDLEPEVIPGVSSIQLACARLGITWEDACLFSCHGRSCAQLAEAVLNRPKVITLTDPRHTPPELARILLQAGVGHRLVFVACNLSYPEETIVATSLRQLAAGESCPSSNCVMVIINEE